MGFGSFSSNDENTSFEQGAPLNQAAKNVAKTATAQVKTQANDTRKALLDQLYGPSGSSTDNTDQQVSDVTKQLTPTGQGQHSSQTPQMQNAQNPEDQGKLDDTRKKLQELQHFHKQNYYDKYLGDEAQKKRRQEEEQRRQQEEQSEEEEKKQIEAEKAQMDEGPLLPAGKKTGAMMGKKQQQPIALRQAKTKTEINRGTSG